VSAIKRAVIGRPLAIHEEEHQRLKKRIALPVFASDALSSTAYATDEILLVLLASAGIGASAWARLTPIAIVVCVLLLIVVLSYRQTIYAYPSGGGSYIVSKENLGTLPSLVAGASLLTDYILTVSVSIAAGVLAITSAVPSWGEHRVLICLIMVVFMTMVNLRGIKESGALFAPPTYIYIVMLVLLIVVGLYRIYVKDLGPINVEALVADGTLSTEALEFSKGTQSLSLLLLLRAFSSGAVALSGVEAVSNGVPAFRKSESRNAAITIAWMGGILGLCFLGLSIVASHVRPYRGEFDPTGIALIAQHVYGNAGVLFWITQIATFAILILAANTAYADFPRLASIIGKDGFLPRQFANRGDRLVYSNGIVFLALMASVLIVVFKGNVTALIPLYAFGVFTGFTLSQSGMVVHHFRLREDNWRVSAVINGTGAVTTFLVAVVVMVSKFTKGAWVPGVVIPLLVVLFLAIKRHYSRLAEALRLSPSEVVEELTNTMVVLVGNVHKGVLQAMQFAQSLQPQHLIALHVSESEESAVLARARWAEYIDFPLDIVINEFRSLNTAVITFIEDLDAKYDYDRITVVIPEFVVTRWWEHLLHNQTALFLKAKLLFKENVAVVSVPYKITTKRP
jgi:amino acid transporter